MDFDLFCPGLKIDGQVLEHALVQSASADFLSLHYTCENRLMKNIRLYKPRKTSRVMTCALRKTKFLRLAYGRLFGKDEWICSLANHSPGEELVALSPEIGAPFDERCMVHFGEDDGQCK